MVYLLKGVRQSTESHTQDQTYIHTFIGYTQTDRQTDGYIDKGKQEYNSVSRLLRDVERGKMEER